METGNIIEDLRKINQEFEFDDDFILSSGEYLQELLDYNKKVNLISRKDESMVVLNHWAHCVLPFKTISELNVDKIVDVGSGGGLPGVLMGLFFRDKHICLVESIKKKTDFLNYFIKKNTISNIEVINGRMEEVVDRKFDMVTARAVSRISNVWNDVFELINDNGYFLTWKGSDNSVEIGDFKKEFHNYKGIEVINYDYNLDSNRIKDTRLILITK